MKYFSGIIILFFMACGSTVSDQQKNTSGNKFSSEKKLKTGIYLQADSLTPGAVPFTVDKPPGKKYYVDTTCLIGEDDFSKLSIEPHGISFEIGFTDRGNLEYATVANKFAKKYVDVIVDNRLIGSYFLYEEWGNFFVGDELSSDTSQSGVIEGLLVEQSWAEKISDSLNKVWSARSNSKPPVNGKWEEHYANGKIFKQEEYKDSVLLLSKEYYSSGTIAYSYLKKDTMIGKDAVSEITKGYYVNGNLSSEKYSDGIFCALYRTYFNNGKLKHETIGANGFYTGPEFIRNYSENGDLEHEEQITYPDQLPCGDKGEFNHPRIYHEKTFNENDNKITSEEEYYSNCGECDLDSSGTWKYYDSGKLIRTKKFPSWQELYKKACSGDQD